MLTYLIYVLFNIGYIINGAMTPITGSSTNDTLIGDGLSNIISGRDGFDSITGGDGIDYFTFVVDSLDNKSDYITDYMAEDKIYLINEPPNVAEFTCQQTETTTQLWFGDSILGQIMSLMESVTVTISTDTGLVDTPVLCDTLPVDPNATTLAPTTTPTTLAPTGSPTIEPTLNPSIAPTTSPTDQPSVSPTLNTESPTTQAPTLLTLTPTKKPSKFPTCAPLVREEIIFLGDSLDCDAGTMLTTNPLVLGCDGLLITANNLQQLTCADIGGCNRTEFNVAAPNGEFVNIEFLTDSFFKGVLTATNPDKVTCRDNACMESVINLNCDADQPCLVSCDGEFGCQFSRFTIENGGSFDCIKMNACEGFIVEFDRTSSDIAGALLNCDGDSVCKDGSITKANGLTDISCLGLSACDNLFIQYELTPQTINIEIECQADFSCKNMNIDFGRLGTGGQVNVILNITCNGIEACHGFDISQNSVNIDASVSCEFTSSCENAFIAGSPFSSFINPAYNFEPENGNPTTAGNCKNNKYLGLIAVIAVSVGLNFIFIIIQIIQLTKRRRADKDAPTPEQISAEIINATKASPQSVA